MTTIEYNNCVDEFSDGVYRFILKNIKDVDKAKDIVQDSFTKMWEKVSDIAAEKAKSYLFSTAYHTMIDHIRKDSRMNRYDTEYNNILSTDHSYNDLQEVLEEALAKLPDIQRSVLLLRDYEGYSYKEIGDITELSEAQVKVYIYRARLYMKSYIVSLENVI